LFARLKTWLTRRRFERHFVRPYAKLAEEARARHAKGAKAAFEMQKAAVRAALERAVAR
jgi:hypothetical protein